MKLRLKDSVGIPPIGHKNTHHRDTESAEKSPSKYLSDLSASVVNSNGSLAGLPQILRNLGKLINFTLDIVLHL